MRLQGKILNWNDDKGFGFVEQNGGGERAFVHIKAFQPRSQRPVNGEIITYELVSDKANRYIAENIKFARNPKNLSKRNKAKSRGTLGTAFTLIFCTGLLASVFAGKLPPIMAGIYAVMSLLTFIAYATDKSSAQNGRWRTSERTLHLFALIGGWPGAFFAQSILRHKSSKREFKSIFWVTVLVNIGTVFWLHTEKGISFLNNVIYLFVIG